MRKVQPHSKTLSDCIKRVAYKPKPILPLWMQLRTDIEGFELDQILREANHLASRPPPWLHVLRRATLLSVTGDRLLVATRTGEVELCANKILSLVGYRPDSSLLNELAVSLDPAWEGGLGLARALAGVTDCLAKIELQRSDLESGEPDLYLVGHRAYGRRNSFLLRTGIEQVEAIFSGWKLSRKS
jgi:hypothetical protein